MVLSVAFVGFFGFPAVLVSTGRANIDTGDGIIAILAVMALSVAVGLMIIKSAMKD